MRHYHIGQRVTYLTTEFDGTFTTEATITEVGEDYAVATTIDGGMKLWIDADTEFQFH